MSGAPSARRKVTKPGRENPKRMPGCSRASSALERPFRAGLAGDEEMLVPTSFGMN